MAGGSLRLEAPGDAFIDQVLAVNGPVRQRQQLLLLQSPLLDRLLSRISTYEEHIAITLRPFKDGRVDEEIRAIKVKHDALQDAVTLCQQIFKDQQDRLNVGQVTPVDVAAAHKDLLSAQSALADATVALNQAPAKKVDMIDKMKLASDTLSVHKKYLDAMKNAMTIYSPVSGEFKVYVGVGLFVKKGHILGEIVL